MLQPGPHSAILSLADGTAWDHARLVAEIGARSARLAAAGVGQGDRVLLAHGGSPAFFGDLFACWRLGAVAACADPALTPPEMATLLDLIAPAAVLVAGPPDDPGTPPRLCLDGPPDPGLAPLPVTPAPDDPALILFTSGSTGVPKAVLHSAGALTRRVTLNAAQIGDAALSRTLLVLPTHFGHGLIGNALTPLAAGGALILAGGNAIRTAATLGPTIDAHGITFLSSVPSLWRLVLRACPPPQGGTLRRIHIGSAPLSAELWARVIDWSGGAEVVNMYGLTEAANWAAGASSRDHAPEDGLVGTMWGGEAAVRGADGLAARGTGEILLKTPGVMLGYLGDGAPPSPVVDGWLETGDTGTIDANGVIRLTGRIRTEINRAGLKVHPEEVELVLERHPAITEACVFALPDPMAGETVGAAIAGDGLPDARALDTWCAGQLRAPARPERWFFVDALPKNDRGKIDRRAVRSACLGEDEG